MSFDGTVGAPNASGVIKLSRAELDLYQLNLALRQIVHRQGGLEADEANEYVEKLKNEKRYRRDVY